MKSVGTINEILNLFYKKIDDISIHTKHIVANGKYVYEGRGRRQWKWFI